MEKFGVSEPLYILILTPSLVYYKLLQASLEHHSVQRSDYQKQKTNQKKKKQ